MKKNILLLFSFLILMMSCQKEKIDSSNQVNFRKSINQMASKLDTRKQVKFTEALYILKTFGTEETNYTKQMTALRNMLSGKQVQDVFNMADQLAQKEGIEWSSSSPPSLGEMNVFEETVAVEADPNEIMADDEFIIDIKPTAYDSIYGPQAIRIIPRLTKNGNRLYFKKVTLPTTLEVYSGGKKLLKRKNLIQDSDFKGYYVSYKNLPIEDINDGKVDIYITIKTTNKTYKSSKIGVRVNQKSSDNTQLKTVHYAEFPTEEEIKKTNADSLKSTQVSIDKGTEVTSNAQKVESKTKEVPNESSINQPKVNPQNTVQRFLSNLNAQNLKAAYKNSANPSWGNYEKFSNPNSGFGSVKKLNIKNIETKSINNAKAIVNATYDVVDKNGNASSLNVTFGLKNDNGTWKIESYTLK